MTIKSKIKVVKAIKTLNEELARLTKRFDKNNDSPDGNYYKEHIIMINGVYGIKSLTKQQDL